MMLNLEIALLTATLTILGGVIVFVAEKLLSKYVLDPVFEHERIASDISVTISYWSNVIGAYEEYNPKSEQASDALRNLALRLPANYKAIRFNSFVRRFLALPPREDIEKATRALIRLSNSTYRTGSVSFVSEYKKEIADALDIEYM